MPPHIKAELIKGVVYLASPVSTNFHGDPHADLVGWMGIYRTYTPGVRVSDNATVLELEGDNEPQPDASLRILQAFGGRTRIDEKGYMAGAPELAAEVAASNVRLALGDKLDMYRANGTQEYIVWRVLDAAIDWFVLRGDRYERLPLSAGIFKSEVFPGLWLDPEALMHGDMGGSVVSGRAAGPRQPRACRICATASEGGRKSDVALLRRLRFRIGSLTPEGTHMRWFSCLALTLSFAALGVSLYTWQQADARAEAALRRREKALVDKYRPGILKFYKETNMKAPPEDAQTLDELLAPLGKLFEGLSK